MNNNKTLTHPIRYEQNSSEVGGGSSEDNLIKNPFEKVWKLDILRWGH